jgi:hypothetical protein
MGNQIYFKIAEYVDLAVLIIFTSILLTSYYPKPAILPLYVLFLVTAVMLVGARHHRVSYCHHLASVVLRRKLFQKSSPLKVLDQWKPNLV